MQKLGILHLSRKLKPTPTPKPKTIRPPKQKPLPPSPNSKRRSSRIQTLPTVDYTPKRVIVNEVIEDVKVEIKPCHQCRRNRTECCKCKTDQGQFCGGCLITRYGENVLEVMEDPHWVCPVCRDICNCSRCRRLKGWKPTGNLYRKAVGLGFKSVAHYLNEMQGPDGKLDDDVDDEDCDQKLKREDGDDDFDDKSDPIDDDDDEEKEDDDDDDYKSDPLDNDNDDDDEDNDDDDEYVKDDLD